MKILDLFFEIELSHDVDSSIHGMELVPSGPSSDPGGRLKMRGGNRSNASKDDIVGLCVLLPPTLIDVYLAYSGCSCRGRRRIAGRIDIPQIHSSFDMRPITFGFQHKRDEVFPFHERLSIFKKRYMIKFDRQHCFRRREKQIMIGLEDEYPQKFVGVECG
jgi:hypothetical protein